MSTVELKTLLESGVQFGHMSSYWNPSMAPYIYCVRQKMHIIDLRKTKPMLEQAIDFVEQLADGINERKSKVKTKIKKEAQKKHQALIDQSQELDEMELEIDHLFSEYDKKN